MAIVVTVDGRRGSLGWLLELYQRFNLYLYVNDYTPTGTDLPSDFVVPSFDGFQPLMLDQWGTVYLNSAGDAVSDHQLLTFSVAILGLAEDVYGYFVLDPFGYVAWAERNPAGPVPMYRPGDTYLVLPRISSGALC